MYRQLEIVLTRLDSYGTFVILNYIHRYIDNLIDTKTVIVLYKILLFFQARMQQELLSNPDMLRQVLDNPLVQQMMNDPENMRTLITSNPQMQDLMSVSDTHICEFIYFFKLLHNCLFFLGYLVLMVNSSYWSCSGFKLLSNK